MSIIPSYSEGFSRKVWLLTWYYWQTRDNADSCGACGFAILLTPAQTRALVVGMMKCPYSEPETGSFPGPGAYGSLQDNSSFNKTAPKTLTDEKIGFSSTGRRTTAGSHSAEIPGPGQYDLDLQSIAGGLEYKRRIGCKGVFG